MPASVQEQIQARVFAALLNATTVGASVYRAETNGFTAEDTPLINIRRVAGNEDLLGNNLQRWVAQWEIDLHVGEDPGWETAVDALHMEAHAILAADAQLNQLGRGLRCINTETASDSADRVVGKLTARYQMQISVRPGDLTRQIT